MLLKHGKEVNHPMKKSIILTVVVAVLGLVGALRAAQQPSPAPAA